MGGSGGGSGGDVNWPVDVKNLSYQIISGFSHDPNNRPNWETGPGTGPAADFIPNVFEDIHFAHSDTGGNPYAGVSAFSPNIDFNALRGEHIQMKSEIWTNFDMFVEENRRTMNQILDRYTFDTQVTSFRDKQKIRYNESTAALNGGFLDIRAVQTSNYSQFLALQHAKIIDEPSKDFAAQLDIKFKDLQANGIMSLNQSRMTAMTNMQNLRHDEVRMRIMGKQDEIQIDTKYEVGEAEWDLNLYQYAGNLIAAMSGGTGRASGTQEQESLMGNFLGSAANGIGAYAALAAIPGVGAPLAIGAGILTGVAGII